MKKILVSWSSGKDSAWMLHQLLADERYKVSGLFTTINESANRIAMHAVRVDLLKQQVEAIGLDLKLIPLPYPCSNDDYENIMTGFITHCSDNEIDCIAFGDLFLADIRSYREKQMHNTGIEPIFPIWLQDTSLLAQKVIDHGYKAVITSIDLRKLDRRFVGRNYDKHFIADLPAGIDPCGENGEFHSFVYDGPIFQHPIPIDKGTLVEKDDFLYQDLIFSET